jgi:hypothetical protein
MLVPLSEAKQFPLRIGQAASRGDLAEPLGKLSIMISTVAKPPVPIGGDLQQRRRVFFWHSARYEEHVFLIY